MRSSHVQKNWNRLVAMDDGIVQKFAFLYNKTLSFLRYRMSGERKAWSNFAQEQMLFLDLILNYEPIPFDGKFTLVVTGEEDEAGFEESWEKVAVNGLEIHRIPGGHHTFLHESAYIVGNIIRELTKKL